MVKNNGFMGKVDFRTVKTKNLRNPRDRAPLSQDALLPSRRPGSSKPDKVNPGLARILIIVLHMYFR